MKRSSVALVVLALLALPQAAPAAYPGTAGDLAFTREHLVTDGNGVRSVAESIWKSAPGGTPEQISPDDRYLAPTWSPDGKRIAYLANPAHRPYGEGIQIAAANGAAERFIFFSTLSIVDRPTWSPDGTRLAFAAWTIDYESGQSYCARGPVWSYSRLQTCDIDVYLVNADGTGLTPLVAGFDPAWSPDGSSIAYAAYGADGTSEIHTISPNGSAHAQLTTNGARDEEPAWSPDGTQIAFASDRDGAVPGWGDTGGPGELYAMDAAVGNVRRLTANTVYDSSPAWAPDGSRIAFATIRRTPGCVPNYFATNPCSSDVYTMNPDGSDQGVAVFLGLDVDWQPLGNRPPDCSSVYASPGVLQPANRQFVPVELLGASDPDPGDSATVTATGISQDEPVTGRGDNTLPDAREGQSPSSVEIRAERSAQGDGRVYQVDFTAQDERGATCTGTAAVEVRRHNGVPAQDSAPPSYGSTF